MCDKLCEVCQRNEGKYTCPSCNIVYCSVGCFRDEAHLSCSEVFYKRCVEEELQFQKHDADSKKIADILNRAHDALTDGCIDVDDDSDDYTENDDEEDLSKRMENVDLNNEVEVWNKLTADEKKDFQTLLSSGRIREVLPEWEPWWKFCVSKKIIIEAQPEFDCTPEAIPCPSVNFTVPPILKLTTKVPSANVPYMVVNVLMSYAYTARWYKGAHSDMPVEGVTTLFSLSSVLRNNKVFRNFLEAYVDFENDLKNCKQLAQNEIGADLIWNDIVLIAEGSTRNDVYFSVKACLYDVYNLLETALKILKPNVLQPVRFTGPPPPSLEIKLSLKKIMYYLSWVEAYGEQLTGPLTSVTDDWEKLCKI